MKHSKVRRVLALAGAGILTVALSACGGSTGSTDSAASSDSGTKTLNVVGAFSSSIEEPWDGVVHAALEEAQKAGEITYKMVDKIGYASGAMERTLRQICEEDKPDIIFGDSYGNEEAARAVAKDYPNIAFVMGSGGGPSGANFSVFDNWIHEPAYVSGMLAGGLTKSNVIGIVAGYPVPEVNRIVNAFIAGAQAQNPKIQVKTTFISSWFDPAAAKDAALAQVSAGADILFAERSGVIEAAQSKGLLSFGNQMDQKSVAPDSVVTSNVWNMKPTVDYVIAEVKAKSYTSQDLKDFSMVGKGGAMLTEVNTGVKGGVPQALIDSAMKKYEDIKSGAFRVDISEGQPAGSTVKPAK